MKTMLEVASSQTSAGSGLSSVASGKRYWFWILLAVVSLANVWPILWYQYLPFMDHPSHLLQYNILANRSAPEFGYHLFYAPTLLPAPNILNDYLTALLGQLFPIDLASRIAIAGAMWLLPVSVCFYLSKARPGTEAWAFFAIPMAWSSFLFFGNENFCLSAPLLFFLLGILADWKGQLSWKRVVPMVLLGTSIYFAHFLVFAVAGLAIVLHAALGDRSRRSIAQHLLLVLPGTVFFLIWQALKQESLPSVTRWEFNLMEKVNAFLIAIAPVPWETMVQTLLWPSLVAGLLGLSLVGGWIVFRSGSRFIPLLVLSCWVIALLLQRWTFIFIPDQRIWWLSFMIGLGLFPSVARVGTFRICLFAIPLVIGTCVMAGRRFEEPNAQLAQFEKAFAQFPPKLRLLYFGDPSLPPYLHRAYEYYHIRKGGRSTLQFVGNEHSVRWAEGVFKAPIGPGLSIYDYSADAWIPYLDQFDGAMIVGNPSPASQQIIVALQVQGFRLVQSGGITLMLGPNWKQEVP